MFLMLTEIANVTMHIIIQRKCVCVGISRPTPLHLTIIKMFSVPRSDIQVIINEVCFFYVCMTQFKYRIRNKSTQDQGFFIQNHWDLAPQNSGTQVNVGTLIPFYKFQKHLDQYLKRTFIIHYRVLLPFTDKTKPQVLFALFNIITWKI